MWHVERTTCRACTAPTARGRRRKGRRAPEAAKGTGRGNSLARNATGPPTRSANGQQGQQPAWRRAPATPPPTQPSPPTPVAPSPPPTMVSAKVAARWESAPESTQPSPHAGWRACFAQMIPTLSKDTSPADDRGPTTTDSRTRTGAESAADQPEVDFGTTAARHFVIATTPLQEVCTPSLWEMVREMTQRPWRHCVIATPMTKAWRKSRHDDVAR